MSSISPNQLSSPKNASRPQIASQTLGAGNLAQDEAKWREREARAKEKREARDQQEDDDDKLKGARSASPMRRSSSPMRR